jgi:hypothetical protein
MRLLKISSLLLPLAAMVGVVPALGSTCSNASLNGVFGFLNAGYDSTEGGDHGTSVGQITYNGKGKVSGTLTHSDKGTISALTFTGTYSVSKNCTGSTVEVQSNDVTVHNNFVIDESNAGTQFIISDSGPIQTGLLLAQGAATCGLTGKVETFAVNVIGTNSLLGGATGYVGQMILNGKGKVSGSGTLDIAGTAHSGSLTGTYTEKANCTGTLKITPSGGALSDFNFVVVNAGKELLLIETDNGATVFGNAQQ